MQRIGRSSALMPVYIALACWILVQAPTAAAQAGPFAKTLDIADPAMTLSSAQREAARALGEASRLVESGETVEARRALGRVSGVPQLAGYAELVWAIIREESHYRVDARSVVGALGLLQLMPKTAAQLATKQGLDSFESEDLFDPRTNITLGSAYLAQLGTRFDGRMSAAIGSYNAGPNKVSTWLRGAAGRLEDDVWVENIPYDQTRGYVKRVLRSLHVYKVFYRIQ
jgi:soluble lytic murein transglycosylase